MRGTLPGVGGAPDAINREIKITGIESSPFRIYKILACNAKVAIYLLDILMARTIAIAIIDSEQLLFVFEATINDIISVGCIS